MTTSHFLFKAFFCLSIVFFISCKKKDSPIECADTGYDNTTTQWRLINENSGLSDNEIKAIAEDNSGKVWVATVSEYNVPMGGGINGWWIRPTTSLQQVLKTGVVTSVLDSNTSENFKGRSSALHFNLTNEMIMGMVYHQGNTTTPSLLIRSNNVYERSDMSVVSGNDFFSFYENNEGLWFGRPYEGLYVYSAGGNFVKFDHTNSGLPMNCTQFDIVGTTGADFYLNTFEDIMVKGGGSIYSVYDNTNSIGLVQDSDGHRWTVGQNTNPFGYALIKMESLDSTKIMTPINYSAGTISSVAIDSHDNIWIATKGNAAQGLFKYSGSTWTQYTTANSPLHSLELTKLFVDSEGNLWIGSSDAGILVLNEFGTRN